MATEKGGCPKDGTDMRCKLILADLSDSVKPPAVHFRRGLFNASVGLWWSWQETDTKKAC